MLCTGDVDDYGVEMLCSRLPLEGLTNITGTLSGGGKSDEELRDFMKVRWKLHPLSQPTCA